MNALTDIIAAEARRDAFPAARAFADELRLRYGSATAAVIFYGSCLRQGTDDGLILDFYVIVDGVRAALTNPLSAAFAHLLPPNVYYHEMTFEGRTLRAKVAVIGERNFIRGTGPGAFTSALWARFAQPAAVLYARDALIEGRMIAALARAVTTTATHAAALFAEDFAARELWVAAFRETYAAELRPEGADKSEELVGLDLARYEAVTAALFEARKDAPGTYVPPGDARTRARALSAWRRRRLAGKALNAARLIKAAFTFHGGLDYAVAKIERHSGVKVELTDKDRRTPLLTGLRLFFQVKRRGGIE
jgi:hypothetical protein